MDNIIFDTIKIHNFLSIGDASVNLNDRGFTLVRGENCESPIRQSNGAGKSTIFDAIFWCLTGITLRGASEVINEHKKTEGCSCELIFHTLTKNYKIIRNKGKVNNCCFYEDDVLLSDQTKKAQEYIKSAIPSVASPEILGSIILLGQGLPYKFSAKSPSGRKDMLELMSGSSNEISKVKYKLDCEEEAHNKIKSDLALENSKSQGEISGLMSTSMFLQQQIGSMMTPEEITTKVENSNKEIEENTLKIKEYRDQLIEVENQRDMYETFVKQIQGFLSEQQIKQSVLKSQINQTVSNINSIQSGTCPTCGRPYDVSEESEQRKYELEKELEGYTAEESQIGVQISQLNQKLSDRNALFKQASQDIQTIHQQIYTRKGNIDRLNEEIKDLESKKENSDNLQEQLDKNTLNIDILKVKINDANKEIEKQDEYLECIGYLKRQLSRDFKGYMLNEVIQFLTTRAQYYSNYMFTNGKSVEVKLSGNNVLISLGDRLYENLSGGERQRVDLAVQFALRDMLVTTSGFSCNLLVLDEAFDNLDAQGSEALVQLISSEFSDISSIYIVTHHSDISIPYDDQIIVRKEADGISKIL